MPPEQQEEQLKQHMLFHQKQAARSLSKVYRGLASALSYLELALNVRGKVKNNIFLPWQTEIELEPRSKANPYLTRDERNEMTHFLQHHRLTSQELINQLPEEWAVREPKVWGLPPCESAARNMAAQFTEAARNVDRVLKTKPRVPSEGPVGRTLALLRLGV